MAGPVAVVLGGKWVAAGKQKEFVFEDWCSLSLSLSLSHTHTHTHTHRNRSTEKSMTTHQFHRERLDPQGTHLKAVYKHPSVE